MTLVQFVFYSVIAKLEMMHRGETRKIPMSVYLLLAGATLTTMSLSNASLGYLNYPTQVVFKSCKLIAVIAGGILIQKKMFSLMDFGAAGLMCVGLIVFTLADSSVSPNFDIVGIFMLCIALMADAVVSNVQVRFRKSRTTLHHYMYYKCR